MEGGVEGDFDVADEDEFAGDAGGELLPKEVGDERDGVAGGADAGAGDGVHRDAGGGGELG